MRRLFPRTRILAFLLVLVLLTTRFGSLSQETFVHPIQDFIFKTAHLSADDAKAKSHFFKVKRAIADAFCNDVPVLADYIPVVTELDCVLPYNALPEVYLDIFIPPDKAA